MAGQGVLGIFIFSVQSFISGPLTDFHGFQLKKPRGIRLSKAEQCNKLQEGDDDRSSVKDPTPGGVFGDESPGNGSNGRPQERSETVDADCQAPLVCPPTVAERT